MNRTDPPARDRGPEDRLAAEREVRLMLLSTVAHELRTPLSAVKSLLGMFPRLGPPPSAPQQQVLEDVSGAVAGALALIDNLLSLARIEAGTLEIELAELEPAELIERTTDLLRCQAGERGIQLDSEADPGRLVADPEKLGIVLINLLGNAVKYSPDGGRVTARARRRAGDWEFAVEDSGPGMDASACERVFERFVRLHGGPGRAARVDGHGLGLAIARKFTEVHGGRLWVESRPGAGCVFRFTIPAGLTPGHFSSEVSWSGPARPPAAGAAGTLASRPAHDTPAAR